ncbi:hypothetical protein FJY63_03430 [Candidatus Sumerlaeota bacterium]|nr:hypothetical protein [Candidatus Sumerlaeota bacterium]
MLDRYVASRTQRRPVSLLALTVLWVAFLAAKALYAAAVAVAPLFVNYAIESIEKTCDAKFLGFRVGKEWAAPMVALAVVTTIVAAVLTMTCIITRTNPAPGEPARHLIFLRLLTAWVLLDSISFYGIVSKVLDYPDAWCYGFVAASAGLTALAGWPLFIAQRGRAT